MKNTGFRNQKQRVKTAKGRKIGSSKWLGRHLNDPFVKLARSQGYRSRAAFKLLEITEKHPALFKNLDFVIDMGCAPGSWLQVMKKIAPKAQIIGADLQVTEPIDGVRTFVGDLQDQDFVNIIKHHIGGQKADLILSDMAAASTGEPGTDHLRICNLIDIVIEFSENILRDGGSVIAKMLKGRDETLVANKLKSMFEKVIRVKPEASYSNSSEFYFVAIAKFRAN